MLSTMEAEPVEDGASLSTLPELPKQEVGKLQHGDPVIGKVLSYKSAGEMPRLRALLREPKPVRILLRQWERLVFSDGVLYRTVKIKGREIRQLVVPEVMKENILHALHDDVGHQAAEKTTQLAVQRCYWTGMEADICAYCVRSVSGACLPRQGRDSTQRWDRLLPRNHSKYWQ